MSSNESDWVAVITNIVPNLTTKARFLSPFYLDVDNRHIKAYIGGSEITIPKIILYDHYKST